MIYQNLNNIPVGIYQNKDYDLNQNRFYIKKHENYIDIKFLQDLHSHPINPAIYNSPNYWPLLHRDISIGSAFMGYDVPTGSYKFVVTPSAIEVLQSEPSITYQEYVDKAFPIIQEEIKNIFKVHDEVVVPSNGGIDSLVILSYILNLGFIKKTIILNQYNIISRQANSNELYDLNKDAYKNFEKYFSNLVKNFTHDTLDHQDFLYVMNNFDYEKLKCYSTTKMFLMYDNIGFIFGFGGNQALLHHTPILDMVFEKSKIAGKKEILHKLVSAKNYYSQTQFTHAYDVNKTDFCKIEDFTYQYKPWESFQGFNNNKMYYPLGSVSHLGRVLDYSTVDFETILHARMCRELINRNVGDLFDPFIVANTPYDSDNFINIAFDKKDISPSCLSIPQDLNHAEDKLKELTQRINADKIDHFTISVIKMLQHMAKLFGK